MKKYKIVDIHFHSSFGIKSQKPWFYEVKIRKWFCGLIPYWEHVEAFASNGDAQDFIENQK